MKLSLILIGLFSGSAMAQDGEKNLRELKVAVAPINLEVEVPFEFDMQSEHLDLEVIVESGERQLFPLLPGTR